MSLFQTPPPLAAAGPRNTPDLHEAVQKTIVKHQQQRLPCDISRPPPGARVAQPSKTAVQAGQLGQSAALESHPAGQVETARGAAALKTNTRKIFLPTDDSSCSEISVVPKTKHKKKKTNQVKTSTPKKRQMNDTEEHEIDHVYDSISSESETEKMPREAKLFFEKALEGRREDPLTDFIKVTVPKFFTFLRIKEKSANASGTRQQDIADEFNAELDEI